MTYTDKQRIQKIIEICESLDKQIKDRNITREQILQDQFQQWAITTPLYNIGEHVSHISEEVKITYSDAPWKLISGLRNRLVHDYDGINWNIIVDVLFEDLMPFAVMLKKIVSEL